MITFVKCGGISAVIAIMFAVVAFNLDGWQRDWWWFISGMNVGFVLTAYFHDYLTRKSRREMRDEMNAIGVDIVRRMHVYEQQQLVPNPPRDEPPRLH